MNDVVYHCRQDVDRERRCAARANTARAKGAYRTGRIARTGLFSAARLMRALATVEACILDQAADHWRTEAKLVALQLAPGDGNALVLDSIDAADCVRENHLLRSYDAAHGEWDDLCLDVKLDDLRSDIAPWQDIDAMTQLTYTMGRDVYSRASNEWLRDLDSEVTTSSDADEVTSWGEDDSDASVTWALRKRITHTHAQALPADTDGVALGLRRTPVDADLALLDRPTVVAGGRSLQAEDLLRVHGLHHWVTVWGDRTLACDILLGDAFDDALLGEAFDDAIVYEGEGRRRRGHTVPLERPRCDTKLLQIPALTPTPEANRLTTAWRAALQNAFPLPGLERRMPLDHDQRDALNDALAALRQRWPHAKTAERRLILPRAQRLVAALA